MTTARLPVGLLVASLAMTACGDSTMAPSGPALLSHEISSSDLGQALDAAPARVEIKLEDGTLVAHSVELSTSDEMTDDESVRGRVTGIAATDAAGTLTFEMGGLEVTFSPSARFRGDDGDDLTYGEFVGRIQDAIDAGTPLSVRARRPAAGEPQAPDDATFVATDLRLSDRVKSSRIKLNVDADNFQANDAPPPEAWLHVLGLAIEIQSSTEIRADDDHRNETEVRGTVASVDLDGGSVTLEDGTVILVSDAAFDGEHHEHHGDDDGHLTSLQAVQDALDAGETVKAEAEGAVQETDPLTILAHEVEFEIRNGDDDHHGDDDHDGHAATVEFDRMVQSADVGAGSFVLGNGTVVLLTDETVIVSTGDLATLQEVADALGEGKAVHAEGYATVESSGPPLTLSALKVKWELDHDD